MRSMMRITTMAVGLGLLPGGSAWTFAAAAPPASAGFQALAGAGMSSRSQGYLGVDIRDVGDEQIVALKLRESRGAEVIHVDHDGPAGKAGLREHDVVLQLNGQVIEGEDQLRRMLRETPAGRTVTLIISRDGQQMAVTTQLANRQEVERQAWEQRWRVPVPSEEGTSSGASAPAPSVGSGSSSSGGSGTRGQSFFSPGAAARGGHNLIGALSLGSAYTGAMVETLGPQLAEFFGTGGVGVLVHSVDANSPAANAGLRAGDVVVRANAVTLTSSGEWMKVVRENRGKPVQVIVLRDKKEQTLTLVPDSKKRSSVEPQRDGDAKASSIVMAQRMGFSFR